MCTTFIVASLMQKHTNIAQVWLPIKLRIPTLLT